MRGKIILGAMALSLSAAAFANGVAPAPMPTAAPDYFSGFYLGAGVGMQHENGNMQANTVDTYTYHDPGYYQEKNVYGLDVKSDSGDDAFNGEIFAGYGQIFHPENMAEHGLYLGGELYARYADAKAKASASAPSKYTTTMFEGFDGYQNLTTSVNMESSWSYGAALKGGYLITPKTMIYLLVGAEYTDFDFKVNYKCDSNTTYSTKSGKVSYTNNYKFSEDHIAFMPGIGIESMLTNQLSARLQYTYASYGDSDKDSVKTVYKYTPPHPGAETETLTSSSKAKFEPSRGLVTLDLTYHFNNVE